MTEVVDGVKKACDEFRLTSIDKIRTLEDALEYIRRLEFRYGEVLLRLHVMESHKRCKRGGYNQ